MQTPTLPHIINKQHLLDAGMPDATVLAASAIGLNLDEIYKLWITVMAHAPELRQLVLDLIAVFPQPVTSA